MKPEEFAEKFYKIQLRNIKGSTLTDRDSKLLPTWEKLSNNDKELLIKTFEELLIEVSLNEN